MILDRLITLPMLDEMAATVRTGGSREALNTVLDDLAVLQGYDSADLRSASILGENDLIEI